MDPELHTLRSDVSRCSLRASASARSIGRLPPFQALRDAVALPSGLRVPLMQHLVHCRTNPGAALFSCLCLCPVFRQPLAQFLGQLPGFTVASV